MEEKLLVMATIEIDHLLDQHQGKAKLDLLSKGRSQTKRRVQRSKRGVMNDALLADVHNDRLVVPAVRDMVGY